MPLENAHPFLPDELPARADWLSSFVKAARVACPLLLAGVPQGCRSERATIMELDAFGPEVRAAVERVLAAGDGVAVFDADGTLWADDVGEAFFLWQLDGGLLRPELEERARAGWRDYERGELDERGVWAGVAAWQAGLSEEEVREWARDFFPARFAEKVFEPMVSLLRALESAGVETWVCSASHRWIVEAGAAYVGIPPERVIAVAVEVQDGMLTDVIVEPLPLGPGKARALGVRLGLEPRLVVGNSLGDLEMLEIATDAAIVINPSQELERIANERGWAIQRL